MFRVSGTYREGGAKWVYESTPAGACGREYREVRQTAPAGQFNVASLKRIISTLSAADERNRLGAPLYPRPFFAGSGSDGRCRRPIHPKAVTCLTTCSSENERPSAAHHCPTWVTMPTIAFA